jgi:tetratricopeptide (TPR) repeat protein
LDFIIIMATIAFILLLAMAYSSSLRSRNQEPRREWDDLPTQNKKVFEPHSAEYRQAQKVIEDPSVSPLALANAMLIKGRLLSGSFRFLEDGITTLNEIIERFSESDDAKLAYIAAQALMVKAGRIRYLNDDLGIEETIGLYDEVVARFAYRTEPEFLEIATQALMDCTNELVMEEQFQAMVLRYDQIITLHAQSHDAQRLIYTANAMVFKGDCFDNLERPTEAMAIFDDVIERFGCTQNTELLSWVLSAHIKKAHIWVALERRDAAIAVLEPQIIKYCFREEELISSKVLSMYCVKGMILSEVGKLEQGLAAFDEALLRYGHRSEATLIDDMRDLQLERAALLIKMKRFDEALAAYDDAIERAAKDEINGDESFTQAMNMKAEQLILMGLYPEALEAYEAVIQRFDDSDIDLFASEFVAAAYRDKGKILEAQGQVALAIKAYESLIGRFEVDEKECEDEGVAKVLDSAKHRLAALSLS